LGEIFHEWHVGDVVAAEVEGSEVGKICKERHVGDVTTREIQDSDSAGVRVEAVAFPVFESMEVFIGHTRLADVDIMERATKVFFEGFDFCGHRWRGGGWVGAGGELDR